MRTVVSFEDYTFQQPAARRPLQMARPSTTEHHRVTEESRAKARHSGTPPGLTMDSHSGAIAGTPSAVSAGQRYTVSAVNAVGSATADLLLEVNDGPLFYSSPAILQLGTAMTPLVPGGTMYLSGYTVDRALPPGLELDP